MVDDKQSLKCKQPTIKGYLFTSYTTFSCGKIVKNIIEGRKENTLLLNKLKTLLIFNLLLLLLNKMLHRN